MEKNIFTSTTYRVIGTIVMIIAIVIAVLSADPTELSYAIIHFLSSLTAVFSGFYLSQVVLYELYKRW